MNAPSPAVQNRAAAASDASVSQQIAEFAAGVTYESLPVRVRERAKLHMLDVIGTALAATRFEFSHRALAGLATDGAIRRDGGRYVLVDEARLRRELARDWPLAWRRDQRFAPSSGPAV